MGRIEKPSDKKKRGSKSASVVANLDAKKEDISRIVMESVQYFPRKKVETDEECAERLNDYFRQCWAESQIPTVEDMCLALGTTRAVVWDWETRRANVSKERSDMIKRAKEILAAIDAKLVSEGKIPQVTYIFRAKNFFGLKDQTETIVTPNNPLGDTTDPETLRRRYLERAEQPLVEQKENFEIPAEKSQKGDFSEAAPEPSHFTVTEEIPETGSDPGSGADR